MSEEYKKIIPFMTDLIFILGLNTAHDYDGIESDTDILIYQKAIKKKVMELKNPGK